MCASANYVAIIYKCAWLSDLHIQLLDVEDESGLKSAQKRPEVGDVLPLVTKETVLQTHPVLLDKPHQLIIADLKFAYSITDAHNNNNKRKG